MTYFCYIFFYFDTSPHVLQTIFQPNIPSYFGEMDLNARVYVTFYGRRKFSNGHRDLIPLQIFFTWISFSMKVLLILHIKIQLNIPRCSGENADLINFAICSNGSHLDAYTRLNFKSWSLIMLRLRFKIHGCSDLKE